MTRAASTKTPVISSRRAAAAGAGDHPGAAAANTPARAHTSPTTRIAIRNSTTGQQVPVDASAPAQ